MRYYTFKWTRASEQNSPEYTLRFEEYSNNFYNGSNHQVNELWLFLKQNFGFFILQKSCRQNFQNLKSPSWISKVGQFAKN